ncbi:acyl-CoA carboxylase subunit epsilon [Nocardioides rotundus]|uniref:acyl-CoA carboxylase subunit epsilon n=1 Tax=Nocardioides rotundus TaxID=1774216 RepID=UPI001CBC8F36|nr:acyl-CoA carboxylase subunit epsilon [Nocardioides rotundus]UAL28656.1 acyl-CoA carboxylase subunit epsilon [Nocardioides rotundus]
MSDGDERGTSEPLPRPVAGGDEVPALRVVTPDATPEEIAALVAVFSALGSEESPAPRRRPRVWNAPSRLVRRTYPHGPGAWRASGLPR